MKLAIQNLRQGWQTGRKKLSRQFLHWRMRGQPEAEILAAERKLRGVEQFDKLQRADIVVVSFGKSGRTWLRVMISHLFRLMYGLPENAVLGFDNFHNLNKAVPKTFFTHDNYIKDFTGDASSKAPFYHKRVILLARDPRDVAVSQFFQWKFRLAGGRMMPRNKDNPDSYKVRRAKVGGYRDYFSDEEVAAIDRRLAETLDPMFNYH